MSDTSAIILAAGEGKRMGRKDINKVTLPLHGKPMIRYVVEKLAAMKIEPIVVVVGFARESVVDALKGLPVTFVDQKEQLGTANAVVCGLAVLPNDTANIVVIQGDDSAFYTEDMFANIISLHKQKRASITFLTLLLANPKGLGRVIRDNNGSVEKIVEEKDATEEQKQIKEVNPACYVFNYLFLKKYLSMVTKSDVTQEYYLTSLIDLARDHKESIETITMKDMPWRGVNTVEELSEAEKLFTLSV